MSIDLPTGSPPARVAFYNDPKVRSIAYQVALCAVIGFLVYAAARNAIANLERAHIASGFGFWNTTAGFDISQALIQFDSQTSSYGRAFWVGLLNTLLVAGIGIVIATILGFIIGIARLSKNWLVAKVASGYVETIRNIPLLLQLLFWYNAVLKALPEFRESIVIPGGIFLNNRGLFIPEPIFKDGFGWVLIALAAGVVGIIAFHVWARKRQERTGQQAPVFSAGLALVIGLPLAVLALAGFPLAFVFPAAGRFNINGGIARANGSGLFARPDAGTDAAADRGAAGDARHHPAADQPVSQPDQELHTGRGDRLSRSGAGVHRHGAEPDRAGGRSRRHHHGGLPHDQPRDLAADEYLQQPHRAGGKVRAAP